jgi:hypothetical protein
MARHDQFEVVIKPKGRSPADEYLHKGKLWIEGRENSNYVIEITNHHWQRVMAIVSVDGVSVVDGKPASFDSQGYVLAPGSTVSIPGWLVDNQTAAQFVFGKQSESYATQTNQSGNQGVIGVAWFVEKPPVIRTADVYAQWSLIPQNSARPKTWPLTKSIASSSVSSVGDGVGIMTNSILGTGFGESQKFHTTTTEFERASKEPTHVSLVYYDSASNLIRRGIKLKERTSRTDPQAFPGNTNFCAPPPGWATKSWSKN